MLYDIKRDEVGYVKSYNKCDCGNRFLSIKRSLEYTEANAKMMKYVPRDNTGHLQVKRARSVESIK
jgi:hypothetical protein